MGSSNPAVAKEINKLASTFAPRQSGQRSKNPAVPGSWLYQLFTVQAWATLPVGALLSFNVLFPSDEPTIARLMGMWSIWMFTVPSLQARESTPNEKDALNLLFVWKSFGFVFSADVVALFATMYVKVWSQEEP